MQFLEFVKKYNGKKVDFDGHYGYQCVDLFRQYCKDVLEIPHTGGVQGAKDIFLKYRKLPIEKQYFKRISYQGQIPQTGDVVVLGKTKSNRYGHVAIVLSASKKNIFIFEQDGFHQDGAKCRVIGYSYILGFLRKR